VNNVGIMETSEAPDALTAAGLDLQLDLNLRNVMLLTSRFASALRERRGCVVNMSSVAAQISGANGLVYAATKGGMNSFTRVLATAWAPHGVRVNGIAPGYVETDIWTPVADRLGDDGGSNLRKATSAKIPMQRWGTAEEIASVVVFLCSDAASYLTGQTINVDGGVAL
jgi:NAD(P)-dependent dehydrogenase (short-subunit alcohol dehydrogenase family)